MSVDDRASHACARNRYMEIKRFAARNPHITIQWTILKLNNTYNVHAMRAANGEEFHLTNVRARCVMATFGATDM